MYLHNIQLILVFLQSERKSPLGVSTWQGAFGKYFSWTGVCTSIIIFQEITVHTACSYSSFYFNP